MLYMVQRIEFKTNTQPNNLQKKLSKDAKEIKADKTTNYYYKTEPNDYVTFVNKNMKGAGHDNFKRRDNTYIFSWLVPSGLFSFKVTVIILNTES